MSENRAIGDLIEALIDYRGKTPPKSPSGVPLITAKVIKGGIILPEPREYIAEEIYDSWMRRGLPSAGDILITTEAPLGEVAQVGSDARIALAQRVILLRPDCAKVDPQFFFHYLRSPQARASLMRRASGTTVSGIRQPELRAVVVPLLPRPMQEIVGRILDVLDGLIKNNGRRVQVLEEIVRTSYREWFVRFRFPGHEDVPLVDSSVGPIPEGWHALTLGGVIELKYGKALKADARSGGDVAVVGSSGIVGWHNDAQVAGPAIVVGRKGNVGSVTWIDGPCWPIDTTYFVESALPFRFIVEQLRRTEFLNTHAAVPGLSRDLAYSKPFIRPPDRLMIEFAKMSEALASEGSALERQNQCLAKMRDLLLPKLVTGQIDISRLDLDSLAQGAVA
ncbi:restriction endonuclease subunit S [Mycobacterium decipiens]|uniref:restriction endonuclease subunit S n=1 Tax=Mycobacterium decipiens TaxID=1430326 RepID=UPI0013FD86D0|nr:restriction endonuclease subunit S [Mycobacterium decipiens]